MMQRIKKTLYPPFGKLKAFVKTHIFADPFFIATQKFKRDDHRLDLRCTYPLGTDSVIFDLGGYVGEWSFAMYKRYGCNIYIFEPVKEFLDQAREKFGNNPKIRFFDFGLSDKDGKEMIHLHDNASSVFTGKGNSTIILKDVSSVTRDLKIGKIDLLKLNIEGGEFRVLPE